MTRPICPILYFFDDDPIMVQTASEIVEEVVCEIDDYDGVNVATPELRVASTDQDCLDLVRNHVRRNEVPLFVVDMRIDAPDSGLELVKAIRARPSLRFAPVIMLSSHWDSATVNASYKYGANSYLIKSDEPDELSERFTTLVRFWLSNVCHSRALGKRFVDDYFTTFSGGER